MAVTTPEVLAEVNSLHGTRWRLGSRLSGGYQSGAHLLVDEAGRRAVLKWTVDRDWGPTVVAAAPAVAAARQQGWSTPAWLAAGTTADGYPYQVQEHVDGASQETVSHDWLDLVLPVVASQAGLATTAMRDWSRYDHDVVFADRDRHQALLSDHSAAGAKLVAAIVSLTRPYAEVELPSRDLVHGDLNPGNVLIAQGRVALVDVEAVGRGTRLHDLTTLLLYAALWGETEVLDRLAAECRHLAGPGHVEISLSSVALGLFAFGVRHWPAEDLDALCHVAAGAFDRLFRL